MKLLICILLALCPITYYILYFLIYLGACLSTKQKIKDALIDSHMFAKILTSFVFCGYWNKFKNLFTKNIKTNV